MKKWTVIPAMIVLALALGSCGDDPELAQLCEDIIAKNQECGLGADLSDGCDRSPNELERCVLRCAADASCDELLGDPQENPFHQCQAACQGLGENAFICADGIHAIPREGVCDGFQDCPDGSDEADCGADGSDDTSPNGEGGELRLRTGHDRRL